MRTMEPLPREDSCWSVKARERTPTGRTEDSSPHSAGTMHRTISCCTCCPGTQGAPPGPQERARPVQRKSLPEQGTTRLIRLCYEGDFRTWRWYLISTNCLSYLHFFALQQAREVSPKMVNVTAGRMPKNGFRSSTHYDSLSTPPTVYPQSTILTGGFRGIFSVGYTSEGHW